MLNEVFGQSYAYGRMTTIVTVLADDVDFPLASLRLNLKDNKENNIRNLRFVNL